MEAAGLAVGVVALASSFNNAVHCFEYVQIARSFGQSFQTSLIQLDAAKLRLTRWGASIGIAQIDEERSLAQTQLPQEHIAQAQVTLGQVNLLFEQAKVFSSSYQLAGPPSTSFHDPAIDLDAQHLPLHTFMRTLSHKRQGKLNLTQKAKWALRDERRLRSLLEDITDLVDALVGTFPASQGVQKQLCAEEVAEMTSGGNNLSTLRAAVGDQDKLLSETITKALQAAMGGHQPISNVWYGNNNQGFQLGSNTGTISYSYGGKAQ